jgi:hypothetical protein
VAIRWQFRFLPDFENAKRLNLLEATPGIEPG